MSRLTDKLFGTHSEREVKRIRPLVDRIEALRPQMQALTDEELRGKTEEFRKRYQDGETLDDLLVEAYAAVREGARRAPRPRQRAVPQRRLRVGNRDQARHREA